jgi:monothiol glutaredoxin
MSADPVHQRISELVASDRVVLFMKGSRFQPQCGFSATVVGILDGLIPEYTTVNVLADPAIRAGIKDFSSWPTIPQLYVGGEFIGGCDIVREMEASGELRDVLGVDGGEVEPPAITVTDAAVKMLREALDGEDAAIKVSISPRYHHDLSIEDAAQGDVVVERGGLRFAFDRMSAARAKGMSIDFVDAGQGSGFKIDNPNAPPSVKQMAVAELKAKLDAGDDLVLIDVRTPQEREVAAIAGARAFDDALQAELETLDRTTPLVFHCHHGMRSQRAAEYYLSQGFVDVSNVRGGIDAWSAEIDPAVPRY